MKKNKKDSKDSIPGAVPGTVIIVAVMIAVFSAVFAWMYSVDLLFLPDFVEDFLGLSSDEDEDGEKLDELLSLVRTGRSDEWTAVGYDVTYDNLRTAFLAEPTSPGEYVSAAVTYFSDGDQSKHRVVYYRNGDRYRAEVYAEGENGELQTVYVGNGNSVRITDSVSGEYVTVPLADGWSFENEAGIPSVASLIERVALFPENETVTVSESEQDGDYPVKAATDDGDLPIKNCEIKLLRSDNGNVYYVAFTHSYPEIREEYYLSLEYRSIISMQSSYDGEVIYSYEAERISHDTELYGEASLYTFSKSAD